MFKAIKRIVAFFAFVLVVFRALKSIFSWLANSSNDNHEVFTDEEDHERQF